MPITTALDGTALHYAVYDFTAPWKSAPTIVLQHGFARSGKFWFGIVPYLARHFRVICPDLRGMGESTPLENPRERLTPARCIEDFNAIADHAGAETFHLVGESIAGGLALMYAGQYPQRLRSLVVIAPAVYANEWIRRSYALDYPTWEAAIHDLGVEGWARKSNALARFPADMDPAFLEWYVREVGKSDVDAVAALTAAAAAVDARPFLARITAPVLALYPLGGKIATPEMKDQLLAMVPRIHAMHIDSPFQMLNLLEPAQCARAIVNFAALQEGFVPGD
jgi:3-oxoadipate enol-lactonase